MSLNLTLTRHASKKVSFLREPIRYFKMADSETGVEYGWDIERERGFWTKDNGDVRASSAYDWERVQWRLDEGVWVECDKAGNNV